MFEKCHTERLHDVTGSFHLFYHLSSGGAQLYYINTWTMAHTLLVAMLLLGL